MKKIGILGGLGPEATTDYYKEIIKSFNEMNSNASLNYPEIIIYSVNMGKFIGHIQNAEFAMAVEYISNCINMLANAGADFAAISANTPHMLFTEIQSKSNIPIISIVEATKNEAQKLKLKKAGLIGTKFTMNTSFFKDVFQPSGIEIIVPPTSDIETINEKLFTELELGIYKAETQTLLLDIVQKMINSDKIDSLILGCTEFPIMFKNSQYLGIPFLNTTRIHVARIVDACINNN
jgi:aspartate racemase